MLINYALCNVRSLQNEDCGDNNIIGNTGATMQMLQAREPGLLPLLLLKLAHLSSVNNSYTPFTGRVLTISMTEFLIGQSYLTNLMSG